MMETVSTVLKTHYILAWLVAQEDFIRFSHCEASNLV